MDYLEHLQTAWSYAPYALYLFYLFVFFTLLPKSMRKISSFAAADYEANRRKYHRCYGPDICCHTFAENECLPPTKTRKTVTRAYAKKQAVMSTHQNSEQLPTTASCAIKRQVQVSAIPTPHKNVTQIAKMFESGNANMSNKKINRVLPEIRMQFNEPYDMHSSKKCNSQLSQLLQENIENSANLLNSSKVENALISDMELHNDNWSSQSLSAATTILRRTRPNPPTTLTFAGSSATPSTASPAVSSPQSSSLSASPMNSPVLRNAPILNLKSSMEDIFAAIARNAEQSENFIYAGCDTLSPVTSIDDILSQRRLSRPLSAYSISDLLKEESTA